MIRKNCKSSQRKLFSLLDMRSGHSETGEEKFFSVVSSSFRKFIRKFINKFLSYSYLLGLKVLVLVAQFKFIYNQNIVYNIKKYKRLYFIKLKKQLKQLKNRFGEDSKSLKIIFKKVFVNYNLIKNKYISSEKKDLIGFVKALFLNLNNSLKQNKKAVSRFMNYVYPALGVVVLLVSVGVVSNFKYGLSVDCLGKHIGYVEDEYVFLDASKQMNSRINYSEDQEPINDTPVYTLVRLNKNIKCDKKDVVANKLLEASDKIICVASGLYVNDNFIGAVRNNKKLEEIVDGCLEPYKQKFPEDEVEFVDDVVIKKGYFLVDSICSLESINKKVTENVEGEVIYTVQSGDAPVTIATKNSVPYSQLKQLNPDIEENLLPGRKVVVSQSKPLLSVQVNKLDTVTEELPFKIEKYEDANITDKYCKVTQAGRNGLIERQYKTIIIDGIETNREVIGEVVVSEPISEKWLIGTKSDSFQSYKNNKKYGSVVGLRFPVDGGHISCGWYGYRGHTGVDVAARNGTPIRASATGRVVFSGWKGAYGNCILLDIGSGIVLRYAHNSKNLVSVGDCVDVGQEIAKVGQTGRAYGNHCHFEVIVNGVPRNPMLYLNK
ncbi:MAG: peptidoglycan DD-metalloendopeptidase family protein [Oscillospiraceae bacterium]|nr:peptidoglycan DD-metalloendopeptidase family protein [Oscillospiraceae bacterium]